MFRILWNFLKALEIANCFDKIRFQRKYCFKASGGREVILTKFVNVFFNFTGAEMVMNKTLILLITVFFRDTLYSTTFTELKNKDK